ncbi:hypothetical protein [Saccharomonospora sp. CUA-673]|uniref:hypothetical protein n=1 Tax=Saccharomonospora sp. CUA-673 TaxID=1904969 RepID=UPI002100E35B|nr:hypothetical protein [Saccharomonospora sp. CUA-673]
MGIGAHRSIDDIGQHDHLAAKLLPAQVSTSTPTWNETTERHFCDESREQARGHASDQANQWRRTAPAAEKTSHDESTPHGRGGQNTCESFPVTGPDPASGPDRNRRTTHSQNTWEAYANGSPAGIVLHSVPPLLVFVAAEAVTDLRDKLTDAVNAAVREARREGDQTPGSAATEVRKSVRRKLFNDYLDEARQAWTPEVVITPAWIREATGCSRGLSSRLAEALAAEIVSGGDRP